MITRKTLFRIILGAAALLLILIGGYYWLMGRSLASRLAELRKVGDPVCLADLKRSVPNDDNGALVFLQAKKEIEAAEKEIYEAQEKEIAAQKDSAVVEFSPECKEKVHSILAEHSNLLPLMQKAAARDFQFPLDYSILPSQFLANYLPLMQLKRSCMRYLNACANDLLNEGKRDESLAVAVLMLRLTRQYDHDCPILVNTLVNTACRGMALNCANQVLQSGPVAEKSHADLEAELTRHDAMNSARASLKAERAYCLDTMQNELPRYAPTGQWGLNAIDAIDDHLQFTTKNYSSVVSIPVKPPPTGISAIVAGPFGQLMIPALKSFLESAFRIQAQLRSLRIINALQTKPPINPENLPLMSKLGLPNDVGIDPFNGKPIVIKKTPEGWLVYSVGRNLIDDGGQLGDLLDVGFGPKKYMAEKPANGEAK